MKKLLQTIALLIILVCLPFAAYAEEAVPEVKYSAAVDEIFERGNINGTLVVYDTAANTCYIHNAERAAQRFYPASTFKIFNLLCMMLTPTPAISTTRNARRSVFTPPAPLKFLTRSSV